MNKLGEVIADIVIFNIYAFCFYWGWNVFFVEVLNLPKITYLHSLTFLCCCTPIKYCLNRTNDNLDEIIKLIKERDNK
jgi:hypothetical protein